MKIDRFKIHKVLLPLSGDFSHSLKKGTSVHNIVVEVSANHGAMTGYGECAPRAYVTGETQESVCKDITCFLQKDSFPWDLNDLSQIWAFVDSLPSYKACNAAVCALEMSLLDILGKSQNKPIMEYFSKAFFTSRVCYGAALPLTNKTRLLEICRLIKKMKMNKLKLKMGKNFEENKEIIGTITDFLGDDCELKIDVNGAWDRELAFDHVPLIEQYRIKIVEQPLKPGDRDIAEFAVVLQDHGVTLMADESACSLKDVETITRDGHFKMINVRLSKCGGFRQSFKIIDHLRMNGVPFQIAAHLGESGLLSAAGRALSLLCRDALFHDGSYDEFLLKENVTVENVSFGPRGEAGALDGPGLGVTIDDQSLERLSTSSTSIASPK